ncbi:MAG: tetratricopeptide repeat protein, partial [Candidatus Acidiferrales bacterium]
MASAFMTAHMTLTRRFAFLLARSRAAVAAVSLLCLASPLRAAPAPPQDQQASANPTPQKSTAVKLEPGIAVEKALAGGETDSYEIEVGAGQFLHVVVDQEGISVVLALYGPDGEQIAGVDSLSGSYGLIKVSTICDSAGVYRLEIASREMKGHSGRYRVTVNPLRAPAEPDRARIAAERIFRQAAQLSKAGQLKAVPLFKETLPLWRIAGDSYEESQALREIGNRYHSMGDRSSALDFYNQALVLALAAGDRHGQALLLANVGLICGEAGENQKALDYLNQALALHRAVGDHGGEGGTLTSIGRVYSRLGEKKKALDYFNQALSLARSFGNRTAEGVVLNHMGHVYWTLGDNQEALNCYNQALALDRAVGNHAGEAGTLSSIGQVHSTLGENQKALNFYSQALVIDRASNNRQGEAGTLSLMGWIYFQLGEKQKALDHFNHSLSLRRAGGDRQGEASALMNVATANASLGDREKALENYQQALALIRAVGDRDEEGRVLHNLGLLYAELGEKQKALDCYDQALAIKRAVGDLDGEARTLLAIGKIQIRDREFQQGRENLARALALAREAQDPSTEAAVLTSLMRSWARAKQPVIAVFFGKQAINRFQQLRANIGGLPQEEQQSYLQSKKWAYRFLAGLLIREGHLPEAQQVLDLLKNQEYFEFIRRDGKSASSLTGPVTLTKSEESLNQEYEENAGRVTAIGNEWAALRAKPNRTSEEDKHFAELTEQLKAANEAWEKFLNGLYTELGKSREAQKTVESVQEYASGMQRVVRQLGSGVVALYTLVGEDEYRVIVVTPAVMVAREYPIKAEELRKKVFDFRQSLMNPKSDPVPKAQELYRILVGPAEKDLAGAKAETLMWSLDDVLRYIPMAALHDGHGYLVEKYRNEVFTPASLASLTERPDVSAWRGLGMGVSTSYGDFSALPSVPEELHRVIREKGTLGVGGVVPGQMMLDESFTEANMKKALEQNYP